VLLGHPAVSQAFDIVVGAGSSVRRARECVCHGLSVLVLDRGPAGGGTTGAGMGHVGWTTEAQFSSPITRVSSGTNSWRNIPWPDPHPGPLSSDGKGGPKGE
jgi:hypothetical protein